MTAPYPQYPASSPGQPLPAPGAQPPEPTRPGWPKWLRILVPVLVLSLGIGILVMLVATRPKAAKVSKPKAAPLVRVTLVEVGDQTVTVQAQGTMMPARQLVLQPEVTGRVVWHSPDLVPGGLVRAGQALVAINARDYQLAVQHQRAQVASQQLALHVERAQREVAKREWELFQAEQGTPDAGADPDAGALALRAPHMRSAQIALKAAESNLAKARLQLSRTGLVAPFNAFVKTEAVEIGQLVSPGSQLATLVGTDRGWVQVSIAMDELGYLTLPRKGQPGAAARVWLDVGGERVERAGRVVRLLGDLDPAGRMARLLVEVEDPLGLNHHGRDAVARTAAQVPPAPDEIEAKPDSVPLLMGSYVHVALEGKVLHDVAEIPERALRPDGQVFLVGPEDKLEIRQVDVVLRGAETLVVRGPLNAGDRLVLSSIAAPVAGMDVRVLEADAPSSASARAESPQPPAATTASAKPEGASP